MRIGHHLVVVVEVIVLAIGGLNAHDGHPLGDAYADTSVLRFVTVHRFHKRTAFEHLFYFPCLHRLHGLVQRVELVGIQPTAYVVGGDKAVGVFVLDVYLYLLAQCCLGVGLVESRERQHKVDGQQRIYQHGYSFLPIHIHTPMPSGGGLSLYFALLSNIFVTCGARLSRSPAPRNTSTSKLRC